MGRIGVGGGDLDEAAHDLVGPEPLRLCMEVGEDAVAQDGVRDGAYVLDGDVEPACEEGFRLGAEDEVLGRARPGSPGDVLADEVGDRLPRSRPPRRALFSPRRCIAVARRRRSFAVAVAVAVAP